MKLKKLLSSVLAVSMLLSTAAFTVSAEETTNTTIAYVGETTDVLSVGSDYSTVYYGGIPWRVLDKEFSDGQEEAKNGVYLLSEYAYGYGTFWNAHYGPGDYVWNRTGIFTRLDVQYHENGYNGDTSNTHPTNLGYQESDIRKYMTGVGDYEAVYPRSMHEHGNPDNSGLNVSSYFWKTKVTDTEPVPGVEYYIKGEFKLSNCENNNYEKLSVTASDWLPDTWYTYDEDTDTYNLVEEAPADGVTLTCWHDATEYYKVGELDSFEAGVDYYTFEKIASGLDDWEYTKLEMQSNSIAKGALYCAFSITDMKESTSADTEGDGRVILSGTNDRSFATDMGFSDTEISAVLPVNRAGYVNGAATLPSVWTYKNSKAYSDEFVNDTYFLPTASDLNTYLDDNGISKAATFANGDSAQYWLSSMMRYDRVAMVDGGGGEWYQHPTMKTMAIRPAFVLNPDAVQFYAPVNDVDFSAVEDTTNKYKLVLNDSERAFTIDLVSEAENVKTIKYSGAQTGANEYISGVIYDADNNIVAYGKIAEVTTASDEVEIDLSAFDMSDKKLYLFNEQCNGEYETNYASDLVLVGAAKADGEVFATVQAALDSLDGKTGDYEVVILAANCDESFMVNQQEGLNITITAENKGDVTLTGTIYVNGNNNKFNAETLTISNLVFDGSEKTTEHKFIYDYNINTSSNRTYAHNITVSNCDFIGNGDFENATVMAVYVRQGKNIVIDSCTATNMHSLLWVSTVDDIAITNCTVTDCESVTTITQSPKLTFTGNTVDVSAFAVRTGGSTETVSVVDMKDNVIVAGETAFVIRKITTNSTMYDNTITAPSAFTYEDADGSTLAASSTINGVAITSDLITDEISNTNIVIPAALNISFEQVEAGLYNIVLDGEDEIYEFVAAELTFVNTSETVAHEYMNYEVYGIDGATNAEKSITLADTYALRLIDGAGRMSGRDIVIGQVKFFGQGDINFTVEAGTVVTTEYGTNLPQYYTVDADETTTDTLTVDGIVDGAVTEVTRDVVVNVNYNLAFDGTYWKDAAGNAANQITVTVKDGFGNVYDAKDLTKGVATIEDVKLGRLTVTLEAPGFRRYVYNTTLEAGADENDALVLNFWNEVKRDTVQSPLAEIETGKGTMAHNFLVGDIVMDYTVDEYDLAAVTSYYGTYSIAQADAEKYIKYDLNRDGNIDIIDVHYVLHTYDN